MVPAQIVDRARAPDGTPLVLARRGDEWMVRAGGHVLMTSLAHGSEQALARLALERAPGAREVLLGGLGLGYTLRAALDLLAAPARVVVSELVAQVVEWNRGPVAHVAGRPLDDARVEVRVGDVRGEIARARQGFDALLLDVDNGPAALVTTGNRGLYGEAGVRRCHAALRDGGVLAVWSAGPDETYLDRLRRAGFDAETHRLGPGARHRLFLATRLETSARRGVFLARVAGVPAAGGGR